MDTCWSGCTYIGDIETLGSILIRVWWSWTCWCATGMKTIMRKFECTWWVSLSTPAEHTSFCHFLNPYCIISKMILDTLGPGLPSRIVRHTVSNVNYGRYREIRIIFHRCLYVEGCCICLGTNMRSHEVAWDSTTWQIFFPLARVSFMEMSNHVSYSQHMTSTAHHNLMIVRSSVDNNSLQ